MPLGEMVNHGLRLLSRAETILGPSSAGIECPLCHRIRIWAYTHQTTAMTALSHG